MEIFLQIKGEGYDLNRGSFVFVSIIFFFLFTALEYVFYSFMESKAVPFFSLIPAGISFLMLRINDKLSDFAWAVLLAVVLRIIFVYLPSREIIIRYGSFILAGIAVFMCIYWNSFWGDSILDKLVFIALAVLVFSSLQQIIWGRKGGGFPFEYFALLGVLLIVIPIKQEPLDWTRLEEYFGNAADATGYYFSSVFSGSEYTTGYGSLNVTGGTISRSDKLQLVLESVEKPYFVYTDSETGKKMKMRRTLYLAGGRGVDGKALVEWLQFLKDNGVDKEEANVFSQISKLELEYVYLSTADEIAPAGALVIKNDEGYVTEGKGDSKHKKGYKLKVKYLDIDYGSPYLQALYEHPVGALIDRDRMTYAEASDYFKELYNQDLFDVMNEKEYTGYCDNININELYSETRGASERMRELAEKITAGVDNDYDKAKLIEKYLRKYEYSIYAAGGHNPDSDMSTAEGMADIADRFLFETEQGYCVHYTSSMVMLLRLVGIPARVANGYRYSFPFDVQGNYVVEANCAHVWPEAFIENVGWVPFEPTSAYTTAAEYTWHRKGEKELEAEILKQELENQDVPEIPDAEETQIETTYRTASYQLLKIIGVVVLSIALLIILIMLFAEMYRRIQYKLASPEEKIRIDVGLIKEQLYKRAEGKISDRGLISDYLELLPEEKREDLQKVFNVFYRVEYGDLKNHPVTVEENALVFCERIELKTKTKK